MKHWSYRSRLRGPLIQPLSSDFQLWLLLPPPLFQVCLPCSFVLALGWKSSAQSSRDCLPLSWLTEIRFCVGGTALLQKQLPLPILHHLHKHTVEVTLCAPSLRLSSKQYIWFSNQVIYKNQFVRLINSILSHKALQEGWSPETLFLNVSSAAVRGKALSTPSRVRLSHSSDSYSSFKMQGFS